MRVLLILLASILGVSFAVSAAARGFTISDFGAVQSENLCVQKGRLMFSRFGAGGIAATRWTVNAYDLAGKTNLDAALICSHGEHGMTRVSLVVHSAGGRAMDDTRRSIPRKLRLIWDGL